MKNGKNHQKHKNSKTSRNMPKLAIRPLTHRSLIHRGPSQMRKVTYKTAFGVVVEFQAFGEDKHGENCNLVELLRFMKKGCFTDSNFWFNPPNLIQLSIKQMNLGCLDG